MDLYDLSSLQTNSVFLEDSIQVFKYSTLADSGEPENLATPPRKCGALWNVLRVLPRKGIPVTERLDLIQ